MKELNSLIEQAVRDAIDGVENLDNSVSSKLTAKIKAQLEEAVALNSLKSKLEILFEYEKNYLELIKNYKEEIKFASTIQEDLRKERAKIFSETLKEVSGTLSESQVENEVASRWLKELVESYTQSLDLSSGLIEEHTLDMVGKIREQAKIQKQSIDMPTASVVSD